LNKAKPIKRKKKKVTERQRRRDEEKVRERHEGLDHNTVMFILSNIRYTIQSYTCFGVILYICHPFSSTYFEIFHVLC